MMCGMCLELLNDLLIGVTTCGHMFHMACREMYRNDNPQQRVGVARRANALACPMCWNWTPRFGHVFL